jgi:hypothetical protein
MSLFITGAAPYGTFVYGTKVGESEEFSGVLAAGETAVFASIKRWAAMQAPTEQDLSADKAGSASVGGVGTAGEGGGAA